MKDIVRSYIQKNYTSPRFPPQIRLTSTVVDSLLSELDLVYIYIYIGISRQCIDISRYDETLLPKPSKPTFQFELLVYSTVLYTVGFRQLGSYIRIHMRRS